MPEIPLSSPLRPVHGPDDLPEPLWAVLLAICDTVIPHVQVTTDAKDGALQEFMSEMPSKNPVFCGLMRRILFEVLSIADRTLLIRVLKVLSYSAGSFVLTSSCQSLDGQSVANRNKIMKSWGSSHLPPLRLLQRQLAFLTKQAWTRSSPSISKLLGYPRIPVDCKVSPGHDFDFIQFPPGEDEPEVLDTDVVIVGSGCGGGVAAHTLAAAGLRVIVVDKGHYWAPEYLPVAEEQGPNRLFMDGGIMSDDGSMCVIAGETWGGGGTINWSASLQPQGFVRREWADGGLPMFTSTKFQESCDRVIATMGATTKHIQHTKANQDILEGSRKLGWAHAEVPQNTGNTTHNCGHCCMGCRAGEKQGPAANWLPAAHDNGAKFIEGLDVHKVLFKNVGRERVATGVVGTWESRDQYLGASGKDRVKRKVKINATKVIVSAGTLQSPLLLLRSGIDNSQVGRNLHLHPVSMLGAIHEEEMVPWDGPILTSVCSEFENLDGAGHGPKLETPSMTPYTWLVWLPWHSGKEYKELVAQMRNMSGFISVGRDRDTGRVYPDAVNGRCHIAYHPSQFDKKSILEGLVALARINYVQGAREIFCMSAAMDHFKREDGDDQATSDAKFESWIERLRSHGFPSPESLFISAHQMGTCRMSSSPKTGVVDQAGRVWGTKGLHVMDASIFPSASGVNPMVTNMAIADYLSRDIADQWTTGSKL